ncbi:MAG TPA: hypothetical protein VIB02_07685 [Candidatus Limnocylindrales bacterium]
MPRSHVARRLAAVATASALVILTTGVASAHEVRDVAGYQVVVGFIDEPVFVGQKSGLEFFVTKDEQPVEGLEATLQAEVMKDGQTRELPLSARFGEAGAYQSVFFPTAAGPYTFHIFGTIEGNEIDEEFTSSPDGFNEVDELSGGQFPVQYPAQAELVADAEAGANASSQVTIALAVGVAGLLAGLIGIGLALAARRRSA